MNKRIKKLVEQAKAESSQWLGSKPGTIITYDELEKFAELIVRECIQIAEGWSEAGPNDRDAADEIREHFGVDE